MYGYSKSARGDYFPDENAKWVEQMFAMAAIGVSPTDIAKHLNKMKALPKITKKFTGTVIIKILRNPSYMGMIVRSRYYVDETGNVRKNNGTQPPLIIENNHTPIITRELWRKAQNGIPMGTAERGRINRSYTLEELRMECKKYKGRLYCAKCGYALHGSVSKRENVAYFHCYGNGRFGKEFCEVITFPLGAIREFGDFTGNIYISDKTDEYGHRVFSYETEEEWKKTNRKKPPVKFVRDMETACLEGRVYCQKCKRKLLRRSTSHQKNIWTCEGNSKCGVEYCDGIIIPDKYLKGETFTQSRVYIEERSLDGEKYYYYSTKGGKTQKLSGS